MKEHEEYMREAIRLSIQSVEEGGGPFGAIIVDPKRGAVIGRGKNRVARECDPTAHGEIEAIRDAARNTGRTELFGCVLYTSAEPCPGCLTETLCNAEIREIYFGNSAADAMQIGFADARNWDMFGTTAGRMTEQAGGVLQQLLRNEAQEGFMAWRQKADKTEYYRA